MTIFQITSLEIGLCTYVVGLAIDENELVTPERQGIILSCFKISRPFLLFQKWFLSFMEDRND